VRADESRSWFERHSSGFSGVPLAQYYRRFAAECGFNAETIAATEFLVANWRAFRTHAEEGQTGDDQVETFRALCGTEQRLHALYVFTCADRLGWQSEQGHGARWFSVRELYVKTRRAFHPAAIEPERELATAGWAPEDLRILSDFGKDFFSGLYHAHANRFGADLVRLAESKEASAAPRAALLHEGASLILGVAARDFRGLAACISGALWKEGIGLVQAHFFSAMNYGLALDFFHLAPGADAVPHHLPRIVQEAVRAQLHIAPTDEAGLSRLNCAADLQESRPGKFRLRCEAAGDTGGLIYALCVKLFLHLGADIHGLSASTTRAGSFIIIHHSLPHRLTLEEARRIVREVF
jgi:UTP:GlnB (protein PII) uridylyltransferase